MQSLYNTFINIFGVVPDVVQYTEIVHVLEDTGINYNAPSITVNGSALLFVIVIALLVWAVLRCIVNTVGGYRR